MACAPLGVAQPGSERGQLGGGRLVEVVAEPRDDEVQKRGAHRAARSPGAGSACRRGDGGGGMRSHPSARVSRRSALAANLSVVCREQHEAVARGHQREQSLQRRARLGVHRGGGLVGEQQPWAHRRRPRERGELPLAGRQLVRAARSNVRDARSGELFGAAGIALRPAEPGDPQGEVDVLGDRERGQQAALGGEQRDGAAAEGAAAAGGDRGEVLAVDGHEALVGSQQSGDHEQQRALARAERPLDRHELSGGGVEAHAAQGLADAIAPAVCVGDALDGD